MTDENWLEQRKARMNPEVEVQQSSMTPVTLRWQKGVSRSRPHRYSTSTKQVGFSPIRACPNRHQEICREPCPSYAAEHIDKIANRTMLMKSADSQPRRGNHHLQHAIQPLQPHTRYVYPLIPDCQPELTSARHRPIYSAVDPLRSDFRRVRL